MNGDSRPRQAAAGESPSLVEVVKTAAEDLVDLVSAQVKLARLELAEDVRKGLRKIGWVAVFVPPVLGGYMFAMAALASWLSIYWGRPVALAAVAGLQLVGGGAGVAWAVSRLRRVHLLERTGSEMADTVHDAIAAVAAPPGPPARLAPPGPEHASDPANVG